MKWFAVWLSVLGTAAAAQAQDMCPGTWMGDGAERSDPATQGLTVSTVIPAGQVYAGQFRVVDPLTVRIEARGGFGADPLAELYNAAGDLVLTDDDSGGDLSVRAVSPLDPGEYCLVVRSATNGLLPVEVKVSLPTEPALLPVPAGCGTLSDRVTLTLNAPAEVVAVTDPMALDMQLEGPVRLRAEGQSADSLLELYDRSGELIAESDDADGLHAQIDTDALPAGTYCAIVRTYEADGSMVRLSATALDPAMLARARVDAGEISPLPGSDHPVTDLGPLSSRILRDLPAGDTMTWLRVHLDTAGLVLVDALAIGDTDPVLVLFDDAGRALGRNDDKAAGELSSRLAVPLMPGAYLVGLAAVEGNQGPVRLVIDLYLRVE